MKRIANKSLIIIMFVIIFSIAFNLGGTVYAEGEVQPIPEEIVVNTAMETTVEEEKEPEIIEEVPKYGEVILNASNNWSVTLENMPFSREELEAKGLRYEVKEEYLEKFVSIVDEKYLPEREVEAGELGVDRVLTSYLTGDYWWDNPRWVHFQQHKLNFVLKDENNNVLEILEHVYLNDENEWQNSLTKEFFNPKTFKDIKYVYHGLDVNPRED